MNIRLGLATAVLATVPIFAASAVPSAAAPGGTLDGVVRGAAPCIVLSQTGAIDFGQQPYDQPGFLGPTGVERATGSLENCSGEDADVVVHATDATNDAGTWPLVGAGDVPRTQNPCDVASPANAYFLFLFMSDPSFPVTAHAAWLTRSDVVLADHIVPGVPAPVSVRLFMPCAGDVPGAGLATTFSIVFAVTL
jgi:hypothetical protein